MKRFSVPLLIAISLTVVSCSNNFLEADKIEENHLGIADFNTSSEYNEYYEATLKINSSESKQTLELWESMDIDLDIVVKGAGGNPDTYSDLRYQIVRKGFSFPSTPGSGAEIHPCQYNKECPRYPMQPGEWEIRAVIVYPDTSEFGAQTVYSNVVEVDVLYPKIDDILGDYGVQNAMNDIWDRTITNADSIYGHQEFGFLVFAQVDVNGQVEYEVGTIEEGTKVKCPARAEISMSFVPDNVDYSVSGGRYVLAWFHTHPPHRWCSECRDAEPSGIDETTSASNRMPGVLLDFDVVEDVCEGHELDIGYKVVKFGYDRREYRY